MSIELEPFTQTCWWKGVNARQWNKRLREASKLAGVAEIASVLVGMRRVYVMHVHSNDFMESYNTLRMNNMSFFPVNESGSYSGFSHRHLPRMPNKPYHVYGAAVRNDDLEAGELFVEYSNSEPTNHEGIGLELLGYPDCCVNFFKENWGKVSLDPVYEAAINTKNAEVEDGIVTVEAHPFSNPMLRYFGLRITPHLPHSLECEKSIEWGYEWYELMKRTNLRAAEWAVEILSMPSRWDCYRGVAIIDTPLFKGVTNSDQALHKKLVINKGWSHGI